MRTALLLLAFLLVASGGAAIVSGAPVMMMERGVALVIAGSVVMSAGAVLLGLTAILAQLVRMSRLPDGRRAGREPARYRDPAVRAAPAPDAPPPAQPDILSPALSPVQNAGPESAAAPPAVASITASPSREKEGGPAPSLPVPQIVGSYVSESGSYTMYSDGSIDADLPSGMRRFRSLAELKAFSSTVSPGGGEPSGPAQPDDPVTSGAGDVAARLPSTAAIAKA